MGNGTESTYAYYRQCERLQDMLLTAEGGDVIKTQYKYNSVDNILGISNVITPKPPNRERGVRAGSMDGTDGLNADKELDEEAGLYYYGARNMILRTSLWYGCTN